MEVTARAHPIQGLVKYHGLRDPVKRIPFHASVSVCTDGIYTETTVELAETTTAVIDGKVASGRSLERVLFVVEELQRQARSAQGLRIESTNSFPQFVGLGSSSSGFAALALAGAKAYGLDLTLSEVSRIARLGAGSASRAVTGGVSIWRVDGDDSWSEELLAPEEVPDWRIVVPLVPHEVPTDGVHADAAASPLFEARCKHMESVEIPAIEAACAAKDWKAIAAIAERDTLNLHAVTMTGAEGLLTWQPATVQIIHTVRALREQGVPVWFSIDTGATPYLNTDAEHEAQVADAVRNIPGVAEVLHLRPGPEARIL